MEVIEVMSRFAVIERASIDEAYMDLTAAVQQRCKNIADQQIDQRLLRTTHIQGYPFPDDGSNQIDGSALGKGRLVRDYSVIVL